MKRIAYLTCTTSAAKLLCGPLTAQRFAASNTSSKDGGPKDHKSLQGTKRELGDYLVGGNTFYYFGDSAEVTKPQSMSEKSFQKQASRAEKSQPTKQHSSSKSKKVTEVESPNASAANFGANKCIDGGVRISVKQQEKFERQQRKRAKEEKKKEAQQKKKEAKKNAATKKKMEAANRQSSSMEGTQKKDAASQETNPETKVSTMQEDAPTLKQIVSEAKAASNQSERVESEELRGNITPSVPPFGLVKDSISVSAAAKAAEAISSSQSQFSAITTLISDKIISFRAKAARVICPSPDQMLAVQAHEVERRQLKAAKALLALQEGEQLQRQFQSDVQHNTTEVYPNSTTSITGFGLIGHSEKPIEYEISSADKPPMTAQQKSDDEPTWKP